MLHHWFISSRLLEPQKTMGSPWLTRPPIANINPKSMNCLVRQGYPVIDHLFKNFHQRESKWHIFRISYVMLCISIRLKKYGILQTDVPFIGFPMVFPFLPRHNSSAIDPTRSGAPQPRCGKLRRGRSRHSRHSRQRQQRAHFLRCW